LSTGCAKVQAPGWPQEELLRLEKAKLANQEKLAGELDKLRSGGDEPNLGASLRVLRGEEKEERKWGRREGKREREGERWSFVVGVVVWGWRASDRGRPGEWKRMRKIGAKRGECAR